MAIGGQPIIFVCAESYKHYLRWCSENRKNPNDQNIICVTSMETMIHSKGRSWCSDDQRIILGTPNLDVWKLFDQILAILGCPEA